MTTQSALNGLNLAAAAAIALAWAILGGNQVITGWAALAFVVLHLVAFFGWHGANPVSRPILAILTLVVVIFYSSRLLAYIIFPEWIGMVGPLTVATRDLDAATVQSATLYLSVCIGVFWLGVFVLGVGHREGRPTESQAAHFGPTFLALALVVAVVVSATDLIVSGSNWRPEYGGITSSPLKFLARLAMRDVFAILLVPVLVSTWPALTVGQRWIGVFALLLNVAIATASGSRAGVFNVSMAFVYSVLALRPRSLVKGRHLAVAAVGIGGGLAGFYVGTAFRLYAVYGVTGLSEIWAGGYLILAAVSERLNGFDIFAIIHSAGPVGDAGTVLANELASVVNMLVPGEPLYSGINLARNFGLYYLGYSAGRVESEFISFMLGIFGEVNVYLRTVVLPVLFLIGAALTLVYRMLRSRDIYRAYFLVVVYYVINSFGVAYTVREIVQLVIGYLLLSVAYEVLVSQFRRERRMGAGHQAG